MAARILTAPEFLPNLDYPIIDYLTSLFTTSDPDVSDNPIESFVRPLLESEDTISEEDIESVCVTLQAMWDNHCGESARTRKPERLERVLDMRRQEALSKKSASCVLFSPSLSLLLGNRLTGLVHAVIEVVDIESTVKARDTQVNISKLVKAEAKIQAKMEKRHRKNAYEGSKLMDASRGQKSYEELFLEVNPLQSASAGKGKTKDIHLESIDVSFGSLRILSNATITLAEGR